MEIKLPIYEKRQIVKTYTAETYDIMFGTVEDLINVIDIDKFMSGSDKDFGVGVAAAIPGVIGLIKPLLKDIFEGLTDDEIKHCHLADIVNVVIKVIKSSVAQIAVDAAGKN